MAIVSLLACMGRTSHTVRTVARRNTTMETKPSIDTQKSGSDVTQASLPRYRQMQDNEDRKMVAGGIVIDTYGGDNDVIKSRFDLDGQKLTARRS